MRTLSPPAAPPYRPWSARHASSGGHCLEKPHHLIGAQHDRQFRRAVLGTLRGDRRPSSAPIKSRRSTRSTSTPTSRAGEGRPRRRRPCPPDRAARLPALRPPDAEVARDPHRSGGIQEEAPWLGKPVFVMRNVTERPEAVEAGTVAPGRHRPEAHLRRGLRSADRPVRR